jgi:ribonuclease-3
LARRRTSSAPTSRTATAEEVETLAELLADLPEDLARQAFTHASWVDRRADSYERLAFLGDVVLSLAVSSHLYPRLEGLGAGRLTQVRAQAVSGASCARVAEGFGVVERLRERAPAAGQGRSFDILVASERVLASVCEAVIGAAFLAFGIDRTAPAVVASFEGEIETALAGSIDHKSLLQERLARDGDVVDYRIDAEAGPAHDRSFVAVAEVGGRELGRGEGRTKKAAEQEAAQRALEELLGGAC